MSRSDKNWKNQAALRVIEAEEEVEESGIPLSDVLHVGTSFWHRGKVFQIKKISECEGKWRSHVHLNDTHCFDVRTRISCA